VRLFRVVDPAEIEFPFDQPTVFEDYETGRTLTLEPHAARAAYQARWAAHATALRTLSQKLGASLLTLRTDEPLELALAAHVAHRR
jgi:uncharacterized protein (DUF58 family)